MRLHVVVDDELAAYIRDQVARAGYRNASEVVRAALREKRWAEAHPAPEPDRRRRRH
jgi:putative addiction module CopG family antidote